MADIIYQSIPQTDPPRSPRETLPTMYDLPSEDPEEPGLPDEFHDYQPQLLSRTLQLPTYHRDNYFTGTDLNVYYNVKQPLWFKRPDWFLAVGVPRLHDGQDMRLSYVIWQEEAAPCVVVELLSPSTEKEDLGRFYSQQDEADEVEPLTSNGNRTNGNRINGNNTPKKQPKPPSKFEVYEQKLRIPHYIVYSRYTQQLRYFKLNGAAYQEQPTSPQNPAIWLDGLEIGLGIWQGEFAEIPGHWLRWCDRNGNWFSTDTEQAELEKAQAQQAQAQAEQEKNQAQTQLHQTALNLLAMGMTREQVVEITGLSIEQIESL
jgi:Uma2 family endonuclease